MKQFMHLHCCGPAITDRYFSETIKCYIRTVIRAADEVHKKSGAIRAGMWVGAV